MHIFIFKARSEKKKGFYSHNAKQSTFQNRLLQKRNLSVNSVMSKICKKEKFKMPLRKSTAFITVSIM